MMAAVTEPITVPSSPLLDDAATGVGKGDEEEATERGDDVDNEAVVVGLEAPELVGLEPVGLAAPIGRGVVDGTVSLFDGEIEGDSASPNKLVPVVVELVVVGPTVGAEFVVVAVDCPPTTT